MTARVLQTESKQRRHATHTHLRVSHVPCTAQPWRHLRMGCCSHRALRDSPTGEHCPFSGHRVGNDRNAPGSHPRKHQALHARKKTGDCSPERNRTQHLSSARPELPPDTRADRGALDFTVSHSTLNTYLHCTVGSSCFRTAARVRKCPGLTLNLQNYMFLFPFC